MQTGYIKKLESIISPPLHPLDCDETGLIRVKSILRTELPGDFLEFGRRYGSGTITSSYSWEVWSPFRPTYPLIVMEFSRICNIFKEAREISGLPFGIFPEVGGLLPFAKSDDGDWVCWITKDDPDQWNVVDLAQYESGSYEIVNKRFAEYFFDVLTGTHVLQRHQHNPTWAKAAKPSFTQVIYADQGM